MPGLVVVGANNEKYHRRPDPPTVPTDADAGSPVNEIPF